LPLSDEHWAELGNALKMIHNAWYPEDFLKRITREDFSDRWRSQVRHYLEIADNSRFEDRIARQVVSLLQARRSQILDLIQRADRLSEELTAKSPQYVVCHADLHAGNVLLGSQGELYIVDWDTLILAPKERDLMYIGGGLMGHHRSPSEEEAAFYTAYGEVEIDAVAMAYYRYERIIEDIAAFCQQLLDSTDGGYDREQSLLYLKSNFLPNNVIQIAYQADRTINHGPDSKE